MSNSPNATRTKEITATAGMNWIADLLAYLDHTATNSIDGESTAHTGTRKTAKMTTDTLHPDGTPVRHIDHE